MKKQENVQNNDFGQNRFFVVIIQKEMIKETWNFYRILLSISRCNTIFNFEHLRLENVIESFSQADNSSDQILKTIQQKYMYCPSLKIILKKANQRNVRVFFFCEIQQSNFYYMLS